MKKFIIIIPICLSIWSFWNLFEVIRIINHKKVFNAECGFVLLIALFGVALNIYLYFRTLKIIKKL
jgi:hypothetical protein